MGRHVHHGKGVYCPECARQNTGRYALPPTASNPNVSAATSSGTSDAPSFDALYALYSGAVKKSGPPTASDPTSSVNVGVLSIARTLSTSLGVPEENAGALYVAAYARTNPDDEFVFLDNEEAVALIERTIPTSGNEESVTLSVNKVRTGTVVLSAREASALKMMRDGILEWQYKQGNITNDTWDSYTVSRKCTMCGQFISERISHPCPGGKREDELRQRIHEMAFKDPAVSVRTGTGWKAMREIPGEMFIDGQDIEIVKCKALNLSADESEDFFASSNSMNRELILSSFVDKSLFGKMSLDLPEGVRKTIVDQPIRVSDKGVLMTDVNQISVIAAMVEPPLTSREIEHMIDAGGPQTLSALLNVKRTRDAALEVLRHSPSDAAAGLSELGLVDADLVSEAWVTSPDPALRRQAAISTQLSDEDMDILAQDPISDVRKALIDTNMGYRFEMNYYGNPTYATASNEYRKSSQYATAAARKTLENEGRGGSCFSRNPRLLSTFINDPDDEVALMAIREQPFTRQSVAALTQVADPARLRLLKTEYEKLYEKDARKVKAENYARDAFRSRNAKIDYSSREERKAVKKQIQQVLDRNIPVTRSEGLSRLLNSYQEIESSPNERKIRQQAIDGIVTYLNESETFELTPEQRRVLEELKIL